MGGKAKPDKTVRLLVAGAFLVAALALFAGLGKPALMQPDEERNAEVAREMRFSGAWLVPTYNGLPYLDKPAFYFKTVALSFAWLGETQTAARLPSALFGFALLVMLFGFCRRVYQDRCAALAVLVVATSPLYVAFARLVIMDMALAFFVCAAIFAGFRAEEDEPRRARWYLLGAVASGFATLVKGPVGFILPTLVLWIFNWLDHRRGAPKRWLAPLNLVAFFAIVLPWFVGVVRLHPDFAYYGIVEESFHRFATTEHRRTGPIYYFLAWIAVGCFPWSLLLPESIVAAWKTRSRWSRADRLFIVWAVVLTAFFSISRSKRPDYILTVVVALGALTARMFDLALAPGRERAARLVMRGVVLLAVVSAAAAALLRASAFRPGTGDRFLMVRGELYLWLTPVHLLVLSGLILIMLAASVARWQANPRIAFVVFLFVPLMVVTIGFGVFMRYAESKSSRSFADRIPELPSNAEIICLQCFPMAIPLYLHRFVTVVTDSGKEFTSNYIVFMLKKETPWPKGVVRLSEAGHWLATRDRPVYLIARKSGREMLESVAAQRGATVSELESGWWGTLLPITTTQ